LGLAIDGWGGLRAGRGVRLEEGDDKWARAVSVGRRRQRTISGLREAGPWAESGAGPNSFPSAFFSFLCSFSFSFPFLISYLFHIFCIFASNQFKQVSKFS
jgi:hypothetical protein